MAQHPTFEDQLGEPVAGNGLLHRRFFLQTGAAIMGATATLGSARAESIDETELREEAELLAKELGMPSQLLPADPPYPNILRYVAIFDLERGTPSQVVRSPEDGRLKGGPTN